jgi:hypothetical protein
MIMRLPAGRRALVSGANAEEMVWIRIESPGAITFLIDRLPVRDGLAGQNTRQGFFDLIKGTGVCQEPFQGLLGPAKESTDRCLGFERGARFRNKVLHGIGGLTHNSPSVFFGLYAGRSTRSNHRALRQ